MLIVAITGNAGSGKSIFSQQFEELGIDILSSDKINHRVLLNCPFLADWLSSLISADVADSSGLLDKNKIRPIVFKNHDVRYALESVLHPIILQNIELSCALAPRKPYIIIEIPLLYETDIQFTLLDKIILITSDRSQLIQRISNRPGISKEQAENILDSQITDSNKFLSSNAIVINNGNIDSLEKISKLLDRHFRSLQP